MTTDAGWGEGYVTDVEYVPNLHPALAPLNLAVAAVLRGVVPPAVDDDFAYLDLGCGHGFSTALFAAGHPHARFYGNDFNPAHIRNARATAAAAGLGNAEFVEASFAALLDGDLPQVDFVVAHGIWSWISAENRARVVELLGRCLKPGGLLLLSYNCHPGWDALLPLRGLLAAAAREGTSAERAARALAAARALRDAGADYFRETPAAATALETLETADRRYFAHEYFNGQWVLYHPGDVADALRPAGLRYVGQGRLIDNLDDFWLTPDQRALVAAGADDAAREQRRDLILARRFRHDLFVRDGAPMDAAAQNAWFAAARFVPARSRADCSEVPETRVRPFDAWPGAVERVLDALGDDAATGATLAARSGVDPCGVREALTLLIAARHVLPALGERGEAERRRSTDRFNAAGLAAARTGEAFPALASPVTGSGVGVRAGEQVLLDALGWGVPVEALAAVGEGGSDRFRTETLPKLQRLGVV